MIELVNLRKHFGLSQSNIATYLGVSVSAIKMVETGERLLPGIAAARYAHLRRYLDNQPDRPLQETPKADKEDLVIARGELNRYILRTTALIKQQQQQLTVMQTAYQQALRRHGFLQQVRGDVAIVAVDTVWLNWLTITTLRELGENGLKTQTVLQWKIDMNNHGLEKALALEQVFASEKQVGLF